MPDLKINFCGKFAIKIFCATVANAETGSLKSLHTLFDTYLDHILVKIEPKCMVQNLQNFELLNKNLNLKKKKHFWKRVDAILQDVSEAETIFNGKLSIFRKLSFAVPKIMEVWHM